MLNGYTVVPFSLAFFLPASVSATVAVYSPAKVGFVVFS